MYHMDLAKDTEPVWVFVNKSEEVCAINPRLRCVKTGLFVRFIEPSVMRNKIIWMLPHEEIVFGNNADGLQTKLR